MKDRRVERTRQQALMFGRQFLEGDGSVFDQALSARDAQSVRQRTDNPGRINEHTKSHK